MNDQELSELIAFNQLDDDKSTSFDRIYLLTNGRISGTDRRIMLNVIRQRSTNKMQLPQQKQKPKRIKLWTPENSKHDRSPDDWQRIMDEPYEREVKPKIAPKKP